MYHLPNRIIHRSRDAATDIEVNGSADPLITIAQDGQVKQVIQIGSNAIQQRRSEPSRRSEQVDVDARVSVQLPGIAPSFHFLAVCAGVGVVVLAIAAAAEHLKPYFEFQPVSLNPFTQEVIHHA